MGWLDVLKALIDPGVIYHAGLSMSYKVAAISGLLLVASSYVRIIETQLAGHGMHGEWWASLRAISLWSFALGAYYMFGALFAGFANDLFRFFADHVGSADGINNELDRIGEFIKAKSKVENSYSLFSIDYWKVFGSKLASVPGLAIGLSGYYISSLLLYIVDGGLRLAHAIVYSFTFIIGLIILPLAISQKISILRGWGMLLGYLLLWPIVDSIFMGLLFLPVHAGTAKLISESTSAAFFDVVNLTFITTAIQLLEVIFKVAALWITAVLVSNYGSAQAAATPFVKIFQKMSQQLRRR